MKPITQSEFRDKAASVLDAVEAGETLHVTRNGVEVVEVRPIPRWRGLSARELLERHRSVRISYSAMRAEADELFGNQDRVDEGD